MTPAGEKKHDLGIVTDEAFRLKERTINSIMPTRRRVTSRRASTNKRNRPGKKTKTALNTPSTNTCAAETGLIGDYLSDNLDSLQRQAFEAHLQACPDCLAFLATYRKTIALTRIFLSGATRQPPKTLNVGVLKADLH